MGIHIRRTPLIAVVGVLALGSASMAAAQDTTAAARQDTSGYQQSGNQTDTSQTSGNAARSDTSGYNANGAATDTALKAKPGVQTGPAAGDTGRMGTGQDTSSYKSSGGQDTSSSEHRMKMSAMDTVVCKDGQNEANSGSGACGSHGGVDTAATWAALKARGHHPSSDTSSSKSSGTSSDSSSTSRSSP